MSTTHALSRCGINLAHEPVVSLKLTRCHTVTIKDGVDRIRAVSVPEALHRDRTVELNLLTVSLNDGEVLTTMSLTRDIVELIRHTLWCEVTSGEASLCAVRNRITSPVRNAEGRVELHDILLIGTRISHATPAIVNPLFVDLSAPEALIVERLVLKADRSTHDLRLLGRKDGIIHVITRGERHGEATSKGSKPE